MNPASFFKSILYCILCILHIFSFLKIIRYFEITLKFVHYDRTVMHILIFYAHFHLLTQHLLNALNNMYSMYTSDIEAIC